MNANINLGRYILNPFKVVANANVSVTVAPASIDGQALTSGDRVFLSAQSTASQNGGWIFVSAGAPMTRSEDLPVGATIKSGTTFICNAGTVFGDKLIVVYAASDAPIIIGTTTISISVISGSNSFSDALFNIYDNADNTKIAVFQASAIATGTTRTFTFPNNSGTVALLSDILTTFSDASFNIYDNADNTKIAAFQASGITTGTTRTFTFPDANGTIALVASTEVPLTFSTGLTRATNTITSNLSTGVAGGQSVIGGAAASENLTVSSTTHPTKGNILFGSSAYDEANNMLGVGINSALSATIHGKGIGATSATYVEKLENSAGTQLFYVRNDGYVSLTNNTATSIGTITKALDLGGQYANAHGTTNLKLIVFNGSGTSYAGQGISYTGAGQTEYYSYVSNNAWDFSWYQGSSEVVRASMDSGSFSIRRPHPDLGFGCSIIFKLNNDSNVITTYGSVGAEITDNTAGSEDGDLVFKTAAAGSSTEKARVTSTGNLGVGAGATVSARIHAVSTTEQVRIAYDVSNYYSTTVASNGAVTFNAVGAGSSFVFSDNVTLSSTEFHTGITTSSGPGAVSVAGRIHQITTTGTGDALTLANGTNGQRLTICYVAEGAGGDTAVLTPTTLAGAATTITFGALGDSVELVYQTIGGWYIVGVNGAVIA